MIKSMRTTTQRIPIRTQLQYSIIYCPGCYRVTLLLRNNGRPLHPGTMENLSNLRTKNYNPMKSNNQLNEKPELLNQSNGQMCYNADVSRLSQKFVRSAQSLKEIGSGEMVQFKIYQHVKPKLLMFRTIILILILIAETNGALAQINTSPTQTVCPGTEPYYVVPDNINNTATWTVTPNGGWSISEGVDQWHININWGEPIAPAEYNVTLTESNIVTGCIQSVSVLVIVSPAPAPPVSSGDITQCELSPIQTLTATATAPAGSTVTWYTAPDGGSIVTNPILNAVGTLTYYAESVVTSGGCTSLTRTAVTLSISPSPAPPTSGGDIAQCELSPTQTLTATALAPSGSTVIWYTSPAGGTVVTNPILNSAGTVTYYAESIATSGVCTSLTRTPVTLTISTAPEPPASNGDIEQCELSPIQILTATATATAGSTVTWYTSPDGGTAIASPTLNSVGTVTYYAESVMTIGGCTSLIRTPVNLIISPAPKPHVAGSNPVCQSINNTTEVYNTINVIGNSYNWNVVGGTFTGQGTNQIAVTWTTPGTGSVSVTETGINGCTGTDTLGITIQSAPSTSNIYHN
jgi:surface antigen